jgi:hypothetical protein
MKILLRVTAAVEAATAIGLLLAPSWVVTVLFDRPPGTALSMLLARLVGAPLLALSMACWLAAGDSAGPAASALVFAMLLYDTTAAVLLVYGGAVVRLAGVGLWPAAIAHVALGVWCIAALRRASDREG